MGLSNEALLQMYDQYFEKANEYTEKKDYLESVLGYTKSLAIGEILENRELIVKAKLEIANVQFKNRNLRDAHRLYTELLNYTDSLSEEEFLLMHNRLGITSMLMGRYQEASDIFEEIAKRDNPRARRKAYNNMGVMYYYLHTFFDEQCMDKAIQCFEQAYALSGDDQLMRHKVLRNIGMAFYEKHDYSTALRKLKESLLHTENKIELASTLDELAKVYIELRDYDQALQNLREAEKILLNKNYRNLEELSRNIFNHGLLAKKQNRYESAYSHFQTALQGFVEKELYPDAILVCREIYQMYKDSHPERANFYLDQYQFYLNYLDPMD